MKNNLESAGIRLILVLIELVFVGGLIYIRIQNFGWMALIFGIVLLLWVFFHLGLMVAFIVGARLSVLDALLYLGVHFFYLLGWLMQSDGGDDGPVRWTIEVFYSSTPFNDVLQKWGENLFWVGCIGAVIFYVVIGILLIVRLVVWLRARGKSTAVLEAVPLPAG